MVAGIRKYWQEYVVCIIFLFFAFGFNLYRVQGDGRLYYAFLERLLHISHPESPAGMLKLGFQQAGCVIFNAPFYLLGYFAEMMLNRHIDFNGITLRQISINLSSNFYILGAIVLVVRILRLLRFKHIVLPVLCVLFSTSAFVVGTVMPSYNHAVEIFINTLCVFLFLKSEKALTTKRIFIFGFMCGLAVFVRYFNFVYFLGFLIYYVSAHQTRKTWAFVAGFVSLAWLLPVIFAVFNGGMFNMFFAGESAVVLTASTISWWPRYALKILLHPLHGLFVWSPVIIVSVFGFVVLMKRQNFFSVLCIGICTALVVLYGFFFSWYAGWSFSNRYLVGLFPFFCVGLAAFQDEYGRWVPLVLGVATLYSLFLFFNWYLGVLNGEFGTPFNMVEAWMRGTSPTFAGNKLDIEIFIRKIADLCRYKYLLRWHW